MQRSQMLSSTGRCREFVYGSDDNANYGNYDGQKEEDGEIDLGFTIGVCYAQVKWAERVKVWIDGR